MNTLNIIKLITDSTTVLCDYLNSEDCSDLFDGTVQIKVNGYPHPLADVAIAAAFMRNDAEREVVLSDIRAAVTDWISRRELVEV